MSVHRDEVLFDPLPQPYRFLNKLLLQCIEEAADLAEGGGVQETRTAFIGHNLKLTKVGTIPVIQAKQFFLSTQIDEQEISIYSLLGNSHYLVAGTNLGDIIILDLVEMTTVYTVNVTTISKFAKQSPVTHLTCFETDHGHFILSFATEDIACILLLSPSFVVRSTVEIDISTFSIETLTITCQQLPYLVVTDGTGRTLVYNCHTPPEIAALENSTTPAKSQGGKQVQLELVVDIEKCPITDGPVTSEAQLTQKQEDPVSKKRAVKKKPPPAKGRTRAKSPGTTVVENQQNPESLRNHAFVSVFDQAAVVRFGTFPVLLIYSTQHPNTILSEFPLPCAVTATLELTEGNRLVVGMENGSFCVLNVLRKSLHDHQFPKQGSITKFMLENGILFIFTSTKVITGYKFEDYHINGLVYTCSDDNILECQLVDDVIVSHNQKSTEASLTKALTKTTVWDAREFQYFPNMSILQANDGGYIGSISTPVNLEIFQSVWNRNYVIFAYIDPVEYRLPVASSGSSSYGRRSTQKGAKQTTPVKKPVKASKPQQDGTEEPEPTVVIKRHILALLNIPETLEEFKNTLFLMEKEKQRKLEFIKSLAHREA